MSFTPYPNEVYTTFSFFGLLMCIIPLPWHLKAWNVGTCLFMFWAGTGCLIFFVNSIVWHGNALNPAPIWCDICVKLFIGTFTGISASSLCINRRLYLLQLDPVKNFASTKSDKIRSIAIDLGISLLLPTVMMILHYSYQGHRFEIRENIGCYPHNRKTWVAILLMNVPPALIGLVSATYGIRSIISINKRRNQFNELLASHLHITSSLYFRLMCFAGMEALSTTPIAVSFIIFNVKLYPWISRENPHFDLSRVDQYPATVWHTFPDASGYEFTRWIHVLAAFVFFSIFGFAEEAKSHYRLTIDFFLNLFGIRVGRQTDILGFQDGGRSSMLQSGPAERLILISADKTPCRSDSLSTISISHGRTQGEQWSSSGPALGGGDGHLESQTDPLISTKSARVLVAIKREHERTPRNSRNLHSFLDLDRNDSTSPRVPFVHSSQMDIAAIEEDQPSNLANRFSSNRMSQPLYSFLNLN